MNTKDMEQFYQLLSKQIDRYTSKESSSIPYTKAIQLMDSILYCIEMAEYTPSKDITLLSSYTKNSLEDEFRLGLANVKKLVIETKELYDSVIEHFHSYGNVCYYDTIIKGIPAFFLYYNPEFDSKNILLTLDYPLLYEIQDKEGVLKIQEYLHCISLEQQFLSRFSKASIENLLSAYADDCSELIINIPATILPNIIGSLLIGRSPNPLHLSENERECLCKIANHSSINQLKQLIKDALQQFIDKEYNMAPTLYSYLSKHIDRFVNEYKMLAEKGTLEHLFLSEGHGPIDNSVIFLESPSMSDEDLRLLIEKLRDSNQLADKLLLVKEHARSLSDLKELLYTSFYENEFPEVFKLLDPVECNLLVKEIEEKNQFDEDLYEWELSLLEWAQKHSL